MNTGKSLPQTCPSCHSELKVERLKCPECQTEVTGTFDLPLFSQFTDEEQAFIINFVKASGSLKKMAGIVDKSYPSVRNYLDELIKKVKKIQSQNKEV